MNGGHESLFREYGATNIHEFFAVSSENFFERPNAFFAYDPNLYLSMTKIYNQNPLVGPGPLIKPPAKILALAKK